MQTPIFLSRSHLSAARNFYLNCEIIQQNNSILNLYGFLQIFKYSMNIVNGLLKDLKTSSLFSFAFDSAGGTCMPMLHVGCMHVNK